MTHHKKTKSKQNKKTHCEHRQTLMHCTKSQETFLDKHERELRVGQECRMKALTWKKYLGLCTLWGWIPSV